MTHPDAREPESWDVWADIETVTAWLNSHNDLTDHEITLRILKIQEEAGEVAEARINQLAQNPRKGKFATEAEVIGELCDVVVTAMVAINSITGDATVSRGFLASRLASVLARVEDTTPEGASQ